MIKDFTVRLPLRTVSFVSGTSFQERQLEKRPLQTDFGFRPRVELENAIRRSQNYLLREQKPEGYWVGELMVDSTIVSDTIAYHHWNGKVDRQWQRTADHHIFSIHLAEHGA